MPAQNMAKISKIHILKEKSLFVSNLQHYLIKCHPLINATLHWTPVMEAKLLIKDTLQYNNTEILNQKNAVVIWVLLV